MNQLVLFYRIDKVIADLAADLLSSYGLFISDESYLAACSLPLALKRTCVRAWWSEASAGGEPMRAGLTAGALAWGRAARSGPPGGPAAVGNKWGWAFAAPKSGGRERIAV